MSDRVNEAAPDHPLERLIFFSDAVFAIAITLLVIEIHVPVLPRDASDAQWAEALLHLVPHFAAFALSFFVIGAVWVHHHHALGLVARGAPRLLWPNLLMLMAVAFLPFSTSLIAWGPARAVTPWVFYAANLLAAAVAKSLMLARALQPSLLAPGVDADMLRRERRWLWAMPVAAAITLLLAFVIAPWNNMAMFLVPVIGRLPGLRRDAR